MILSISARLDYALEQPTDVLLQLEAAALPQQELLEAHIGLSTTEHFARVPAEDGVGDRLLVRMDGSMRCLYESRVRIDRPRPDLPALRAVPVHMLPGDVVKYLMSSRYCPSDEFQTFVAAEFGAEAGGARIAAMRDWIEARFAYVPGCSTAQTTALDTFVQRQGICRDFAHVLITLARASAIPARMASVYAPGVTPQDFHAVAEVYLGDGWHLVDPTGMAQADEMAVIGVGRDAADVAFMTTYGNANLREQEVRVTRAG